MAKPLHITIYYEIGTVVTAKAIQEQLHANPEASEIVLHINSPGGSVYEGYTIYNLLKHSGKKITAKVEGICASIATLIALSAEEIVLLPLAQWLVHNPSVGVEGTKEVLEAAKQELIRIENTIVELYVAKTGKSSEEIIALMDKDVWINAEEALEMGFVTRIAEPLKAVAYYSLPKTNPNNNVMNEEQENSLADKIINGLKGLFQPKAEGEPAPKAASELLEDGTSIYFEGTLAIDTPVFSDEAMTNALAAGDYILTDGRTVVVADGIVADIKEAEASNDATEALAAKDAEIERLTNELAAATAQASAKDTTIKNLRAEVATAKKVTPKQQFAGDNSGNAAPELVPFNSAAEKIKAKFNRK